MKTIKRFKTACLQDVVRVFVISVLSSAFVGCGSVKTAVEADGGFKQTETEYGWGVTGLVGKEINIENTSVFGLASYHRYSFTTGHDNLLQLGVQGRRLLGNEKMFWVGGEIAYVHDKSVYDDADWTNPTSNGFSIGGLAGYKLPIQKLDVSAFTGLSFIHFGDFKADGLIIDPKGNSVQFRLGVDVVLPFFE